MATMGVTDGVAVLVTHAPDGPGELRCDGTLLTKRRPPACSIASSSTGTIAIGQHFADQASGLELVCTFAGNGVLTFAGRPLTDREPRSTHRQHPPTT